MDVRKIAATVPVSREVLDDFPGTLEDWIRAARAERERFAALPPAEQARILNERAAAYEAKRCAACGCHPDEHGGG